MGYLIQVQGNIWEFYTSPRRDSGQLPLNKTFGEVRNSGRAIPPPQSVLSENPNQIDRPANIEIDKIDKIDNIDKINKGELTPDGVNSCGQKPAAFKEKRFRSKWGKTKPNETLEDFLEKIGRSI